MSSDTRSAIERAITEADPHSTNHLVHKLVEQTMCPICQDHMFVPFLTKCGHNYCYECLSQWLQEHQTCPSCRGLIEDMPYLNVPLQDLVETIYACTGELLKSEIPNEVKRDRQMKIDHYRKDLKQKNLFKQIFLSPHAVTDDIDGISRCSNCHWEIDGDVCPNCNLRVRSLGTGLRNEEDENVYSSEEEPRWSDIQARILGGELSDSDVDLEPNPYDLSEHESDDDFLDDRPIGELEIHDDSFDQSSAGSSPVRREGVVRYIPSVLSEDNEPWEDQSRGSDIDDMESWHGFHTSPTQFPHSSSSGSTSTEGQHQVVELGLDSYNLTDEEDEDEDEEEDKPVIRTSPRRRRIISGFISDEEQIE